MDLIHDFKKTAKHLGGISFGIVDITGYPDWALERDILEVPHLQLFKEDKKYPVNFPGWGDDGSARYLQMVSFVSGMM